VRHEVELFVNDKFERLGRRDCNDAVRLIPMFRDDFASTGQVRPVVEQYATREVRQSPQQFPSSRFV
jgi:hypothetical protein